MLKIKELLNNSTFRLTIMSVVILSVCCFVFLYDKLIIDSPDITITGSISLTNSQQLNEEEIEIAGDEYDTSPNITSCYIVDATALKDMGISLQGWLDMDEQVSEFMNDAGYESKKLYIIEEGIKKPYKKSGTVYFKCTISDCEDILNVSYDTRYNTYSFFITPESE